MTFTRPALPDLRLRSEGDLVGRLELSGPVLTRALTRIIGRVIAGCSHLLHGHVSFLVDQIFPDRSEEAFLKRQASLRGMAPTEATYSTGPAELVGDDGVTVVAGRELYRADGTGYRTTADATIAGGVASVALEAIEPGSVGNSPAGIQLSFASPAPGVNSVATVQSPGISGGADAEQVEAFRARFIARLREQPRGGTEVDWVLWTLEVGGVTRAWCYPHELGLGTVVIRFVRDADSPIIPDAGEVTTVQNYLQTKRPATADLTTLAPSALAVPFTLTGTFSQAQKDAVQAELDDLFFREAEPGDGAGKGTILLEAMRTAIGTALGDDHPWGLTTPSANVVPALGQLAMRGAITWP
jgi:uncharacterized phage protein gp47/JayE